MIAVNPKTSGTGELFVSSIAGDGKPAYVAGARIVDFSDDTVAQVAADPDAVSYVRALETRYDERMAGELPTGDELAAELERFLAFDIELNAAGVSVWLNKASSPSQA